MHETHHLIDELRHLARHDHCPSCGSPQPRLHPKRADGSIRTCLDRFHLAAALPVVPAGAPADLTVPAFTPHTTETSATTAAELTTPEDHPMGFLADAKTDAQLVAAHFEALAANPLVDAIVEEGIGLVLPAADVQAVVTFIKALEASRKQQDTGQSADSPAPAATASAVTNQG